MIPLTCDGPAAVFDACESTATALLLSCWRIFEAPVLPEPHWYAWFSQVPAKTFQHGRERVQSLGADFQIARYERYAPCVSANRPSLVPLVLIRPIPFKQARFPDRVGERDGERRRKLSQQLQSTEIPLLQPYGSTVVLFEHPDAVMPLRRGVFRPVVSNYHAIVMSAHRLPVGAIRFGDFGKIGLEALRAMRLFVRRSWIDWLDIKDPGRIIPFFTGGECSSSHTKTSWPFRLSLASDPAAIMLNHLHCLRWPFVGVAP